MRILTALTLSTLLAPVAMATPFIPIPEPIPTPTCDVPPEVAEGMCEDGYVWSNKRCACMPDFLEPAPPPRRIGFVAVELTPIPGMCPDPPFGPWEPEEPVYLQVEPGRYVRTTAGALEEASAAGLPLEELIGPEPEVVESPSADLAAG